LAGIEAQVLIVPLAHSRGVLGLKEYTAYTGHSFWLFHFEKFVS
jgi:hypothetical protein